jgi:N-acetylglucosamine-6-phosphate deacetylase
VKKLFFNLILIYYNSFYNITNIWRKNMSENKYNYILSGGTVISPFKTLKNLKIVIEGGKISRILPENIPIVNEEKFDFIFFSENEYICPGFIDIHTHGGGGQDCVGGEIETVSKFKISQGITGYLPTFVASPLEDIYNSFDSINSHLRKHKNIVLPHILGVHIEGIYLSKEYRGAQPLEYLRVPEIKECEEIIERSKGLIKIMTLAPEVKGCQEVIKLLSGYGIISSVGHSNARPEDIDSAIDNGLSHATHTFNAMGGIGFEEQGVRSPGLEGYLLVRDEVKVEIIGEKTHVNPAIMEIAYRTKGPCKIIIVSDSMSVSGLLPGEYKIGVLDLILEKDADVARLKKGRGLAGSVVPINKALKTFYENTTATLAEAIQMVTFNPIESLGLSYCKGTIEVGKDADITVINDNFNISKVFIGGKMAFDNNNVDSIGGFK